MTTTATRPTTDEDTGFSTVGALLTRRAARVRDLVDLATLCCDDLRVYEVAGLDIAHEVVVIDDELETVHGVTPPAWPLYRGKVRRG